MKYALTYNFESKAELEKHLAQMDSANGVSTPVAPKAKAVLAKSKDVVAKDVLEDVVLPEAPKAPEANLFAPAPAVASTPIPNVPTALAPQQAQAPFDRNMVIANINATINEKTSKGIQGAAIAQVCANVFAKIGVAVGTKIGQLDDQSLYNFSGHFLTDIQAVQPLQAAPQNNFI